MSEQVLAANFPTLPEFLYEELRRRILDGSLREGSQLAQVDLADQYGVSRTPIREALARLDREGLVEFRPRRGYIVASIDIEQIEEVCELRSFIEVRASSLAALRRTKADLADLENILALLDEQRPGSVREISGWVRANRKFHLRLIATSRREIFVRVAETLHDSVERFVLLEGTMLEPLGVEVGKAQAEHYEIFEAVVKSDADRVGALVRVHCDHTRDRLISSLRQKRADARPLT